MFSSNQICLPSPLKSAAATISAPELETLDDMVNFPSPLLVCTFITSLPTVAKSIPMLLAQQMESPTPAHSAHQIVPLRLTRRFRCSLIRVNEPVESLMALHDIYFPISVDVRRRHR